MPLYILNIVNSLFEDNGILLKMIRVVDFQTKKFRCNKDCIIITSEVTIKNKLLIY